MKHYILKGKTPVDVDLITWAQWMEKTDRHIKDTQLPDGTHVSTVFLGLDHAFGGEKPILFETMIFGGEHDQYQERYSTWEQAKAGHQRVIELVFS